MNDILLGPDYELLIENGDFVIAQSDVQNIQLLIDLHKGNLKQYPLTGVGKERLLNGIVDGAMRAEIQKQLEADGYRAKTIAFANNQLIIRA
jgi:hypothetical protein